MLLSQIIESWLREVHATNVTARSHKTVSKAVYNHLIPTVADLSYDTMPKELLSKLNEISPANTRRRMFGVLNNALDYAVICEQIAHNPVTPLQKYLKKSDYTCKSFSVLPKKEWGNFFHDVEKMHYRKATKVLFWAIAYSALRRSEATQALKSEFDFNAGAWTVPASRMKNKHAHTVYLAPSLQLMLIELFNSNNSRFAFPSSHAGGEKPLAAWAAYQILRKLNYEKRQTLHGLRKIYSSHAHESGLFSSDAVELSIDHKISGVRGIYNVAKYETERRQLAKWYGLELDKWRGIA